MKRKQWLLFALFCFGIALISLAPYWFHGVNLEHDTCFHLSRIEGLAQSFKEGVFLPRIYPYKNNNFGYASPLFYSDFFLVLPALLYNAGLSLARSYQFLLLLCGFFSAGFMGILTMKISKRQLAAYFSSFLYIFSLYRLTDIYVRGALGEVLAFVFMPVALIGIYEVLWADNKKWPWLAAGYSGLLLSHTISFYLMVLSFGVFILFRHHELSQQKHRIVAIVKAVLWSLGLCSFYLWPMLEQITSQELYLHYYAGSSDLAATALNAWQYTEMTMNFAVSSVFNEPGQALSTNLGLLIPVLPLLGIFLFDQKKTEERKFLCLLCGLGYFCYFLCSRLFPWEYFAWMRIIQFPWRLMSLADLFLCPVAAVITVRFFNKRSSAVISVLMIAGAGLGLIRILPVIERPIVFGIDMPYESLIDGTLLDPYYGDSFYVRPEIAGADYLPAAQTDYRTASRCVTVDHQEIACLLEKKGIQTSFEITNVQANAKLLVPMTYYKGYSAYAIDNSGNKVHLILTKNKDLGLIEVNNNNVTSGKIVVIYSGTGIQKVSALISLLTCCLWIFKQLPLGKRIESFQNG